MTNPREPELIGQTVVLIGGSAGIGLETARRARAAGAEVILTAATPTGSSRRRSTSAPSAPRRSTPTTRHRWRTSSAACRPDPSCADHGRRPELCTPPADDRRTGARSVERARRRGAPGRAPRRRQDDRGGSLTLMGGTGGRRIGRGLGIVSAATAALPPFTAALALELAPVRVNLIAAGFVDTPLSASLLGDRLQERRNELASTLPIGRVVGPADVAALAVHLMSNTALTGATYDIDGGQQFV